MLHLFKEELGVFAFDKIEVLVDRSPKQINYKPNLVKVIVTREKNLPVEEFSEDATDRPDIDRLGVLLASDQQLGRTVPTSRDVFRHLIEILGVRAAESGKPKVTDFYLAIGVDENVARF